MPGIVGIISRSAKVARAGLVEAMLSTMRHEPAYISGTYSDAPAGASLGWVCHPGSFADCMPVWNETRDICLIWSGENFVDSKDIEHLRTREHCFAGGRAEYLVHLYEEYGTKFLSRLNGWFSGVLLDLRESPTVVVFNDRYGLGRLYYHETPDAFFFASEAKALLKVLPHLRQIDWRGLGEFFSCGCPLQNRTLFVGVNLLPPGSAWVFPLTGPRREDSYFRPRMWLDQAPLSADEYYEKLKEIFPRVVERYLTAPQPLALSLTGGVDSRMIMAWTQCRAASLPMYTFAGMFRDCRDVHLARRVAEISRQQHQVIRVGEDFMANFGRLAEKTVFVSDGLMDVSGAPDMYVNEIAKGIAPIRLTGNYGGEILRRIVAFKPTALKSDLFQPELRQQIATAEQTYQEERKENDLAFVAFKQVPWHHYARLSVEQSQLTVRSPYLDNDLVSLAFQIPPEHARTNDFSMRLIAEGSPRLGSLCTDRGIQRDALPGFSRVRNLFEEFTFRAEYAYDYGMPHWLAKIDRSVKHLKLERLFLGRHKFYHFRLWYRDQLSTYVKEILLDPRTRSRNHLDGVELEKAVTDHLRGTRNYTREIHRVITCELLQRQLLETQ